MGTNETAKWNASKNNFKLTSDDNYARNASILSSTLLPPMSTTKSFSTTTLLKSFAATSQNSTFHKLFPFKNLSEYNSSDFYENGTSNEFLEINDANQAYDDSNNDSAKLSYESGSNFMLLLEDFGEYFYNYNGSDFNSTLNEYQANCSLSNRTCEDVNASKYFLLINYNGLLKWDFLSKSEWKYFSHGGTRTKRL